MERYTLTLADAQVAERIKKVKHILKDIKLMVDWSPIAQILSVTDYRYQNSTGRDCYSPMIMFYVLLIQRIYGYSDREMESHILGNFIYMWFCDLSFDSPTPDHVTIHRWRERFIKFDIYQQVFDAFNAQLVAKGYILKNATIVDATLIKSAARPRKNSVVATEVYSESDDSKEEVIISSSISKDEDARWTFKNGEYVYGYKDHQAVNSDGIITCVITTPANVHDGNMLPDILATVKPASGTKVIADKASDSDKNRELLKKLELQDGLMRRKKPKQPASEELILFNKSLSSVRFVVERTFGTLKRMYNLGRSKYLGLQKTHNWCVFGALVYNLSRCRKLTWESCIQT